MEKRTKITVRDLNLYYGENHALKDVNMNIRENCVTAFIGPSGCGKSTFLKTLNRMNDQMRVNMKLDKDREKSYAHHAVDAMLIAFSQLGYEAYRKLQGEFIDFETGEILNSEKWKDQMSDGIYKEYLYRKKWSNIRNEITRAEKNVKYWYYVDHKSNRGLCNQKIRGTRVYDGKIYKINKLDIRKKEGAALFKKLAFSEKESDREKLLVYKNDKKTYEDLVRIMQDYSDSKNPFVQYEKETGDYVRKYAKKHNGPRIDKLKYIDGEVGSCIDISHKYGYEKGSRKVVLESLVPYRMDVYYKKEEQTYYLVGIKQSDVKCQKGEYVIDEDAYAINLVKEKMIQQGQKRSDLESLGFEFQLSFYKNDIIECHMTLPLLPDLEEQGVYAEVAMEKEDWKTYIKDFVKQILEYKPEAVYVTADLFAAYPVVHALRKKHMPVLMHAKKEGKTRIVRLPSGS